MGTKTKPKNERMFMKSIEFIKDNPDITTHKLPDRLLKYWIVPKFTKNMEYKISDDQILIFMYIVGLNKMSEKKVERFLNSYRFNQLFFSFQIILAATEYSRRTNVRLEPFPVFDIEKYIIPDLNVPEMLVKQYNSIVVKSMIQEI